MESIGVWRSVRSTNPYGVGIELFEVQTARGEDAEGQMVNHGMIYVASAIYTRL